MTHKAAPLLLLLAGCAAASPPRLPPVAPASLQVVSYNIRAGRGLDGRFDVERTAAVLARLAPDIVALQEVDERVERSGRVDQAARLGELLGMDHAFGSFMDFQGGRYGLAILTRVRIRAARPLRLIEGNEPRVALAVELDLADGTRLTVVNVHFDWVAADSFRIAQARQVAAFLDGLDGPWLLLGDFNDQPGSRTLALFQERAAEARKPATERFTFPANQPDREIDFIFAAPSGAWAVGAATVVEETAASDHRPVSATVRWQPGVGGATPGASRGEAATVRKALRFP